MALPLVLLALVAAPNTPLQVLVDDTLTTGLNLQCTGDHCTGKSVVSAALNGSRHFGPIVAPESAPFENPGDRLRQPVTLMTHRHLLSFLVDSSTLMHIWGAPTPLEKAGRCTPSVSSRGR